MMPKRSLRVLFRKSYGPGTLNYDLFPGSPVEEFDTLVFHATFNDHWLWGGTAAQMQRDQWCRDAQIAMNGYGCHGRYAHVYVNGLYWGLYNIGERGDASFAAHHMGGEKEDYDAYNPDGVVDGNGTAWNTLFAIADAGVSTDSAYTNLAAYVDIPHFIDYMMVNFYAANTDWPGHNWNAARRRAPGAGLHFFSWDAEWTFGIGNDINTDRFGIGSGDGAAGRLYAALRAHPEFRREFGDRIQRFCFENGPLTPASADAMWMERAKEVEGAIVCELARWGNGNMPGTWFAAQGQVRSWFPQRATIFVNQARNAGLYPQLKAPGANSASGLVAPGYSLTLTNPNTSGLVYYTVDGTDPRLWGGAIAPSARAYTGAITLTNATALRLRVREGTNWSAVVERLFYVVQDFRGLAVTEIMYRPTLFGSYTAEDLEFLELKNTGSNTLDLSGLTFTDGITFTFTNGTLLAPGRFFILTRNPAAFAARYPGAAVNGVYSGRLDNGGEKLTLSHVLGTNAFSFKYENKEPWPITPDGYGFSLVPSGVAGDPDVAASWRASSSLGGSPGADDPVSSIAPVVINEILTHTDPPAMDAIELYNPGATNVNVGGWYLTDDAAQPKKYRISDGTEIFAGGYLVVTEADFNPTPGVPPSFALSSMGESLYLFSGNSVSNLTGYSHSFEYGAAALGVSLGRYVVSTGEEQWPAMSATTFGTQNAPPKVGPLVINEIMYNPPTGYDEFVELHNLSLSLVKLYDEAFPTNAWKLGGLGYVFSNNVSVPAGGFLLVVGMNPSVFRAKYSIPLGVQIVGPYTGVLQDSGERLRLERPEAPIVGTNGSVTVPYIVVDEVRYNDKAPWPWSADGEGASLQRSSPTAYGNEPTNWFASGITPGTPEFNEPAAGLHCGVPNGRGELPGAGKCDPDSHGLRRRWDRNPCGIL